MAAIPDPFAARVRQLREQARAWGASVFLIDHAELMAWTSGFGISETMYRVCVVPVDGDPWIVLRALDAPLAVKDSWVPTVLAYPDTADPVAEVASSLSDRGYADAVIAHDPNSYGHTVEYHSRMSKLLPGARWVGEAGIADRLRWIKDAAEIALLRRASSIADQTMDELRAQAGPGITTRGAAAVAASTYLRHGADDGHIGRISRGSGDGGGFLHAELDDTPLVAGDILHCELCPRVRHYSARMMRPIVIGRPSAELKEAATALVEMQDAQYRAMRPGVPAAEVDAVLRDAVRASGLRDDYTNVTGYTLGIYHTTPRSSDFSGVFLPTSRWRLEAGMVVHMYVTARGLGFSDTVLIGTDGAEPLTLTPRTLL